MREVALVKIYGHDTYGCDKDVQSRITEWQQVTDQEFWALVRYIQRFTKQGERVAIIQKYGTKEEFAQTVAEALVQQAAADEKAAQEQQKKKEKKKKVKQEAKQKQERVLFERLKKKFDT